MNDTRCFSTGLAAILASLVAFSGAVISARYQAISAIKSATELASAAIQAANEQAKASRDVAQKTADAALAQRQFEAKKPFIERQVQAYSDLMDVTSFFTIEPVGGGPEREKQNEWHNSAANFRKIYRGKFSLTPDDAVSRAAADFEAALQANWNTFQKECPHPEGDTCQSRAAQLRDDLLPPLNKLADSVAAAIKELSHVP